MGLVGLVLLELPAAARTGREVLIKIQESVVLKFILTAVVVLVQNWCQNCQNQTFVSCKVQLEVFCAFCLALCMTSLSALSVTSVCVCCCWQTHIIDSKSIYTVYLQLRSGICLCLQQSSGKAYLLFLFKCIPLSFLPKCVLHKLQASSQMPVCVSAQWKKKERKKNKPQSVCTVLFVFYLSIR